MNTKTFIFVLYTSALMHLGHTYIMNDGTALCMSVLSGIGITMLCAYLFPKEFE